MHVGLFDIDSGLAGTRMHVLVARWPQWVLPAVHDCATEMVAPGNPRERTSWRATPMNTAPFHIWMHPWRRVPGQCRECRSGSRSRAGPGALTFRWQVAAPGGVGHASGDTARGILAL